VSTGGKQQGWHGHGNGDRAIAGILSSHPIDRAGDRRIGIGGLPILVGTMGVPGNQPWQGGKGDRSTAGEGPSEFGPPGLGAGR
jgi:hypothetical protein